MGFNVKFGRKKRNGPPDGQNPFALDGPISPPPSGYSLTPSSLSAPESGSSPLSATPFPSGLEDGDFSASSVTEEPSAQTVRR